MEEGPREKRRISLPASHFFSASALNMELKDVEKQRRAQKDEFSRAAEIERARLRRLRFPGAWTMDPNSTRIMIWEYVMALALVYTIFVVPADVAFVSSNRAKFRSERRFLGLIDSVVWGCFCCDVVLQFFIWAQDSDGQWIREHRAIVRHYLGSRMIYVDIVACLPLHEMLRHSNRISRALRLVKMLRIVKTWRYLKNSTAAQHVRFASSSFSVTSLNIFGILIFFIVAAHWLACIWGYVGNTAAELENSWMRELALNRNDGSIYSIRNPRIQYMFALYFIVTTLTTCGFGDITATNHSERICIILVMIVGGLIWAFILGTVNQAVTQLDVDKIEYTQTYDKVNWMLNDFGVSEPTKAKARAYMSHNGLVYRRSKYAGLFTNLGQSLQTEVCEEVFAEKMSVVPYFHALSNDVRLLIFRKISYVLFTPSEEIILPKTLLIITNSSGQIGYHGRYHYFGDPLFLDFLTSDNDPGDLAVAIHYTHSLALTRSDLIAICEAHPVQTFPILKARVAYAILRLARLIAARRAELATQKISTTFVTDALRTNGPTWNDTRSSRRRANLASPSIQRLVLEYADGQRRRVVAPNLSALLADAKNLSLKTNAALDLGSGDEVHRKAAVDNVALALRTLHRLTPAAQHHTILADVANGLLAAAADEPLQSPPLHGLPEEGPSRVEGNNKNNDDGPDPILIAEDSLSPTSVDTTQRTVAFLRGVPTIRDKQSRYLRACGPAAAPPSNPPSRTPPDDAASSSSPKGCTGLF